LPIESPLSRYSYATGELIQACPECDWAQAGHHKELAHCPACDAPLGDHVALRVGDALVVYTGKRFDLRSRDGGCVSIEQADYPDVIAFMCTHGTDYRSDIRWGVPRVRRVLKSRDFLQTCLDAWNAPHDADVGAA
jgi:hypothetical protein